jgi:serine/threonine protein kinase
VETPRIADPAMLPPGIQVGSWRVVNLHGSGSYGVVYRVERAGQEDAGPFALKVAKHPLDPRFEREWALLSRIRHVNVPRFEVQGWVTLPGGVPYPYVVMEWVEGVPLYEWAAQQRPNTYELGPDVVTVAGSGHGSSPGHWCVVGDTQAFSRRARSGS